MGEPGGLLSMGLHSCVGPGKSSLHASGEGECVIALETNAWSPHVILPFNFYAEYIIRNARLDEAQAGIKIARRNINNLRYADAHVLRLEFPR